MLDNAKLSPLQLSVIIYMFALGSAVLVLPGIIISIAKQDAWISLIMTLVIQMGFAWIYWKLAERFPDETIIEYSNRVMGPILGKCVGISFLLYLFLINTLVLRSVGDFIKDNLLTLTPMEAIHILFMIAVAYGAFLGIEVLARAGEILFVLMIFTVFLSFLLLLPQMRFSNLLPIMPEGWIQPLKGVFPLLGFPLSELSIFLVLFPHVKNKEKLKPYYFFSMALAPLSGVVLALLAITVLGVESASRSPYALYEAVKEVRIGEFLERIEVIIGIVWISTTFMKLGVCFFAVIKCTAQLLHLTQRRALILPYAFILLPFSSLAWENSTQAQDFIFQGWTLYGLFQGLMIPILILLVAVIRKKRKKAAPVE